MSRPNATRGIAPKGARLFAPAGALALAALTTLASAPAQAQPMGGPGRPGMRPGGTGGPGDSKSTEEGPAEQAPEAPERRGAVRTDKEYPGQQERRVSFLQLNGYLRVRSDYFHNFNLDLPSTTTVRPPFPQSLECTRVAGPQSFAPCQDNLSSTNMRLRLEPVINVSEDIKLKAQVDILDNLVFGSTPDGYAIGTNGVPGTSVPSNPQYAPLSAFSRTQVPPQAGRNALTDSIQAKRAWAEVKTPFGQVSFGRMASHWGAGMLVNDGSCLDCNYGVTNDRIMFASRPAGPESPYVVFAGMDWTSTGPNSATLDLGLNQYQGQPWNATKRDDVNQFIFGGGRLQKPEEFESTLAERGQALNYGVYLAYRSQEAEIVNFHLGQNAADAANESQLVNRQAWVLVPDLWLKIALRKFRFEAEVAGIGGRIGSTQELTGSMRDGRILQLGAVGKAEFRFLNDSLRLGLEMGLATGDQAEPGDGSINQRFGSLAIQPDGDRSVTNFRFDPDYRVDLIFWREIMGQVTNAIYWKPWVAYDFVPRFGFRLDLIHSMAQIPVSTPGNARNYGLEMDFSLGYKNHDEGFFAGFQYGFFVPMGALDHPSDLFKLPSYTPTGAAQVLRMQLAVKF